jgi:hypothetical protein
MKTDTIKFIENEVSKMQWMDRRIFTFLEERSLGLINDLSEDNFQNGLDSELKYDLRCCNYKLKEIA